MCGASIEMRVKKELQPEMEGYQVLFRPPPLKEACLVGLLWSPMLELGYKESPVVVVKT